MIDVDQFNSSFENWQIYCKDKDPKPIYCELTSFPTTPNSLASLVTTTVVSGTPITGTSTTTTF